MNYIKINLSNIEFYGEFFNRAIFNHTKSFKELFELLEFADDFEFKGSFFLLEAGIDDKIKKERGRLRIKHLDRKVFTVHIGIKFERHSFLHWSFNRKIKQLAESGCIETFNRLETDSHKTSSGRANEKQLEPIVLTMDHLNIGFLIWILLLAAATLIFLINLLIYRCCQAKSQYLEEFCEKSNYCFKRQL